MIKKTSKSKNKIENQAVKSNKISITSSDYKKRKLEENQTTSSPKKLKNNPTPILSTITISQRSISNQIEEIDNAIQNSKNIIQDYQQQIQTLTNLMLAFQNNIPNLEKEKLELQNQLQHLNTQENQEKISNKKTPWAFDL